METKLVDYLRECDNAYYNTSKPIVSDDTYDALVETLRRINPLHPYLKKVGAKVLSSKVGRLTPMGTLDKYHAEDEVNKWLESEKGEIILSPKYDGFAVELIYQNGLLISASTRGDGMVGENVLGAILRIKSIPVKLSKYPCEYLIVRGEAIIPTKHHDSIKSLGYSAMRNAVPGIVRANREDALGYVDYVAYEFIDGSDDRVDQRMYYAEDFNIEDYRLFNYEDIKGMNKIREEFRNHGYIYELDGVVLKTREIKSDDLLHPSHMVAWKYQSKLRETVLREIEFNVGATGAISVVGIFDPVEFQGAKLTRASFGSLALYREMKPAVGDIIEVSRRGDIVPWIEGVTLGNPERYEELTCCPCCGTPLVDDKCPNKSCSERLRLQIAQYARAIGIKGIGDKLIRGLIDAGYIKSIVDIYSMDPKSILNIPRQGQSAVEKWMALQEKKLSSLELLTAYPFNDLGRKIWESLLKEYDYEDILTIKSEDLDGIKGIGEVKIKSIVSQVEENKIELRVLGLVHKVL